MNKYRYTNPDAHGYLMEADACKKVCKEIDRLIDKYNKVVEREKDARKAELETVMQYRSEREIQDDYGYDCITEAQYDRYIQIFRAGQEALENAPMTVNELVVSILNRISGDIYRDQKEWEFSALTPEQQVAERKCAAESHKAWKSKIAEIKARLSGALEE